MNEKGNTAKKIFNFPETNIGNRQGRNEARPLWFIFNRPDWKEKIKKISGNSKEDNIKCGREVAKEVICKLAKDEITEVLHFKMQDLFNIYNNQGFNKKVAFGVFKGCCYEVIRELKKKRLISKGDQGRLTIEKENREKILRLYNYKIKLKAKETKTKPDEEKEKKIMTFNNVEYCQKTLCHLLHEKKGLVKLTTAIVSAHLQAMKDLKIFNEHLDLYSGSFKNTARSLFVSLERKGLIKKTKRGEYSCTHANKKKIYEHFDLQIKEFTEPAKTTANPANVKTSQKKKSKVSLEDKEFERIFKTYQGSDIIIDHLNDISFQVGELKITVKKAEGITISPPKK